MSIRHVVAALTVAGASLAGAAPALADGPPVPPGCSFDQATGVLTCVTTTTTVSTVGPLTTGGDPSSTYGGVSGTQICDFYYGVSAPWTSISMTDVSLSETVTTTTTTERHGLHGKVFDTSTSTSTSLTGLVLPAGSNLNCGVT
jgi:hypothetical protein